MFTCAVSFHYVNYPYIQVGNTVCNIFQLHLKLMYKMNSLIIVDSYYKMDMDIYMYLVAKSVLLYLTDYFNDFPAFKPEIKLKCFQPSIFITTTSIKCASIIIIYVFIIHSILI